MPLTRFEHGAYDRDEFDILPALIAHNFVSELHHVLGHMLGCISLARRP